MFVNAIERAAEFTRPIHTISRAYGEDRITPGAATVFIVNEEGYALTCKHVVAFLMQAERINSSYRAFKSELAKSNTGNKERQELEAKYELSEGRTIQLKNTFVDCVDTLSGFSHYLHPEYDLAIIKFNDFNKLYCNRFPVFKKAGTELKQGKFLCRLGFPFPEFTNFKLNADNDEIEWTKEGAQASPRFPTEGMVTRFTGSNGVIHGLELSTPGLRGQSGGPLFDENGIICGMQSKTKHLHLGFDVEDKEISVNGNKKRVNDYSFIHLGECVHVDVMKDFMRLHNVRFQEG